MTVPPARTLDGVLFDFDGTLTRRDTMAEFLARCARRGPARGAALVLFTALAGPLWLVPRCRGPLLSAALWLLTAGLPRRAVFALLRDHAAALAADHARLLDPRAVAEWRRHAAEGRAIWVVSGSLAAWIRPVLAAAGLRPARVIGSTPRFVAGGLVLARRCVGAAKVARVAALTRDRRARWHHAYGNAPSDLPMLALARERTWLGAGEPNRRILARRARRPSP